MSEYAVMWFMAENLYKVYGEGFVQQTSIQTSLAI
jgi:hypothetical protein